eukprot:scaffold317503_cov35-Tisochrysis_lutea.AAC.1
MGRFVVQWSGRGASRLSACRPFSQAGSLGARGAAAKTTSSTHFPPSIRAARFVVPVVCGTGDTSLEAAVLSDSHTEVVHEPAERWGDISSSTFDEAHALLVWRVESGRLDETTLSHFRRLRALIRIGVGFDGIDLDAAGKLGIAVCNVPAYGIEEVADTALAHILALYRKTHLLGRRVASRRINSSLNSVVQVEARGAPRIRGQRLGIIGLGRIGMAVAIRAKPFGFSIGFYDPFVADGLHKSIGGLTRFDTVEDLATNSDCVTLHCTHNQSSAQILSADIIRRLPHGARVVNTARGGLVDDNELARALTSGALGGVAVDCQQGEPNITGLPLTRLLYRDPATPRLNLAVTPHSAFYSDASVIEMRTMAAEEARRVVRTQIPDGIVGDEAVKIVLQALRNVVNAEQLQSAQTNEFLRRWTTC